MGIFIKNPETEKIVREVAALRGTTITGAIDALAREALALAAFDHMVSHAPGYRDVFAQSLQLAESTARLAEAKSELATAEPQLPEKEKTIESIWQKYLSMLPK